MLSTLQPQRHRFNPFVKSLVFVVCAIAVVCGMLFLAWGSCTLFGMGTKALFRTFSLTPLWAQEISNLWLGVVSASVIGYAVTFFCAIGKGLLYVLVWVRDLGE